MAHRDRTAAGLPPRQPRGVKDVAWLLVVIVCSFLFVLHVASTLVLVVAREFSRAGTAAVILLGLYWFAMGSWRRTSWGTRDDRPAPPGPPVLPVGRAKLLIVAAVACAAALTVAVVAQVVLAR